MQLTLSSVTVIAPSYNHSQSIENVIARAYTSYFELKLPDKDF